MNRPLMSYAPAICCVDNADCDDGDSCTTDICDPETNQCSHEGVSGCCNANSDCKPPGNGVAKCINNTCESFECLETAESCGSHPCWTAICGGGTCTENCGGGFNTCWDFEVLGVPFSAGTQEPTTGCTSGASLCVTTFECGVVEGVDVDVNCTDFNGPCSVDQTCNESTNKCK